MLGVLREINLRLFQILILSSPSQRNIKGFLEDHFPVKTGLK